jgi:hypothetical protein
VVVVVVGCGGGSSNLMLRPLAAPGGRLHKMTSDECYDDVWWCLTRGPRNATTTISVQVFCEGKPQKKAREKYGCKSLVATIPPWVCPPCGDHPSSLGRYVTIPPLSLTVTQHQGRSFEQGSRLQIDRSAFFVKM